MNVIKVLCLSLLGWVGVCGAEESLPGSNSEIPKPEKPKVDSSKDGENSNPTQGSREGPVAAETVDLQQQDEPVEVPGLTMQPNPIDKSGKGKRIPVQLIAAKSSVRHGEPAVFALEGPEDFLKQAAGRYVFKEASGRELYRGSFKLGELKPIKGGTREITVPTYNALKRKLQLVLVLVGMDDRRLEQKAQIEVLRHREWDGWIGLIHAPYKEARWSELRRMGITGSMAYRLNAARIQALRSSGSSYYVENIAHGLFSRYHTQRGLWNSVLKSYQEDRNDQTPLYRSPSFCSSEFGRVLTKELKRHAELYKEDCPLFYSIASEPSVTRLSAAYDFDFSPPALKEFRRWLERETYGTLSALNKSWSTSFKTWDDVLPMTTDEARLRLKDRLMNFGPWVDFRLFQDVQFAKVLREGATFLKRSDPQARVGITGAMGAFAFGGWDWSRLSESLDVVEAYEIGGARALWRDLAPGKPAVAMIPLSRNPIALREAKRTLWQMALEGGPRGAVFWDQTRNAHNGDADRVLLDAHGTPTPAAVELMPAVRELAGPTGKFLARLRRAKPIVGLLYSPNSVRMNWLLEADALHGSEWLQNWGADTARERRESHQLRLRTSWSKLLSDLGLPWKFISSREIEKGVLKNNRDRVRALVLPGVSSLSDVEVEALKAFVSSGGILVADANCGRFNAHGRLRKTPALDELFGIDTSKTPFLPQPENPLETIKDMSVSWVGSFFPKGKDAVVLEELPPPFSDAPVWSGTRPSKRCEYRKSPVFVRKNVDQGVGVYLNLDLSHYLNSRLKTPSKRAINLRRALRNVVFAPLFDDLPVDVAASTLPRGTELIRLVLPGQADAVMVLALRRNVQERLHELGRAGETNNIFEKKEPFTLMLREKAWVVNVTHSTPPQWANKLEGVLDSVTPAIFILSRKKCLDPVVTVPVSHALNRKLTVKVSVAESGKGGGSNLRFYGIRVFDPTGTERSQYGGAFVVSEETRNIEIPLAVSDPPGNWMVTVHELRSGKIHQAEVGIRQAD